MRKKYLIFLQATLVAAIILAFLIAVVLGGTYKQSVTRVDKDFYIVDGTNIYIRTQFCFEYAYNEEVVIVYNSPYSRIKGTITFLDSKTTYDILGAYKEVSLE